MENNYIYPRETRVLLGIAFLLHKELGCGFKEKVYQDAFEVLLKENDIPYEREKHIKMTYHNVELKHDFFYDFFRIISGIADFYIRGDCRHPDKSVFHTDSFTVILL